MSDLDETRFWIPLLVRGWNRCMTQSLNQLLMLRKTCQHLILLPQSHVRVFKTRRHCLTDQAEAMVAIAGYFRRLPDASWHRQLQQLPLTQIGPHHHPLVVTIWIQQVIGNGVAQMKVMNNGRITKKTKSQ